MLKVEGASWKEQPGSAAMRSPGSRAPTGAAEPQWGGKGQQGKYFLGMHPPGLTSAEFLLLSQSTLSAHPTTRSLRLQQANTPHPIPPGVGELPELGLGAVVPARPSGRVTPASLGVGSSASRARAGRGRAPRRSGGECPRGWRARGECPGEKPQTRCAESPRAWPRFSSRSLRAATTARCEAAALASRSWPLCSGSPRGASREVSPSPLCLCWQGLLRDKARRFAASSVDVRVRVHHRLGDRTRGSSARLLGRVYPCGGTGPGDPTTDGRSLLIPAVGFKLFRLWGFHSGF